MVKSFLFGSEYRYSPVSALYMYGRPQDFALQRARGTINERLHLRLWWTPCVWEEKTVWVGQVSESRRCDIFRGQHAPTTFVFRNLGRSVYCYC